MRVEVEGKWIFDDGLDECFFRERLGLHGKIFEAQVLDLAASIRSGGRVVRSVSGPLNPSGRSRTLMDALLALDEGSEGVNLRAG